MNSGFNLRVGARGFVLFEAMLAVMIFCFAVIALGRCVENCLSAERIKNEGTRARQALDNAMAMIEGGAVVPKDASTQELTGRFTGMTLKTSKVALVEKNEKKQDIFGVFAVTLVVTWVSDGQAQSRERAFYHYPRQR